MRGVLLSLAVLLGLGCSDDAGNPTGDAGAGGTPVGGSAGASAAAGASGRAGSTAQNGGTGGRGGAAGNGSSGSAGTTAGRGGRGGEGGGESGGEGGDSGSGASSGSGGSAGGSGSCDEIVTFEAGRSPTRELFVDAEAAPNGDGSEGSPFATLDDALPALTPGTALRVRPGTYSGGAFASGLSGTAEAPIWIGGVAGAVRPVISGGSTALQLSAASYVIVHDLEISGQSANGVNIDDGEVASGEAHHLIFRNLRFGAIGDGGNQDCLKLSGIDDYFVLDSEFVECGGGSAVDHVGCHRGVIARNRFADLAGNGVQSKGGSDDILITRNRFEAAGERAVNMGGSTGFEFFRPLLSTSQPNFEARDIRVVANLFVGGVSPVAFVGCVDCLAANNTIIDPERWIVRILQETVSEGEYTFEPAQGGRFLNNAVYFSRALLSTYVNVGAETDPDSFSFANNLWYAHDMPADSEPSPLPVAESAGIYGEDPGFADAAAGDFGIAAGSPAAGAGVTLTEARTDVDGDCYSQPPSIGAHEAN
jgi:hypothetical protein